MLQSFNAPASRIIIDPIEVSLRLQGLDASLNQELILAANMAGYQARLEATPASAPTAAGTLHWHELVRVLRTELRLKDWTLKDHKNCPFSISPDKCITILVMTGDEDTGNEHGNPTNQADKGAVVDEAVQLNRQYELFENAAVSALQRGVNGSQLWVLLYHVEKSPAGAKEIRTELSLPSRFNRKKIVSWAERIILKPIKFDEQIEITPAEQNEGIDIAVERRRVE